MCDNSLYTPAIYLKLHGYSSDNFFNMGRKERYDIMCAIYTYKKHHPPIEPENESIGGGVPFPSTS